MSALVRREIIRFIGKHRRSDAPFDVAVAAHWEHEATEYADAGATWLIQSWNAEPGWVEGLREVIERGPAPL